MSKTQSRNFCFTLNNYQDANLEQFAAMECRYLVFGKELAPETGTPHLQGFVVFKSAKTLSAAVKCLPGAHVSIARGTVQQNYEYCTKAGDFVESGTKPLSQVDKGESEKQRWAEIIKLSEDGDWETLKAEYPQVYANSLAKLEHVHNKRPKILENLNNEVIPHIWYYGDPGTGKSRQARIDCPDAYIKNPNTKWWDGYDGQDDVIIDDFDKYQVAQGGDMKRWLDIYPFQGEQKGSQVMMRPKRIIVTSNYHPRDIWEDEITHIAIMRRCRLIKVTRN